VISLLSILAMGFFLGMRHATDADHVIAVSTIVTRQRKIGRAAWTGIFWGIGHTLTILFVGALIILFGVVIPNRVGLSMEFSVGLMLVILGLMNISSFFRALPAGVKADDHEPGVVHSHAHSHGDYVHTHPHAHSPDAHPHDPERTPVTALDRGFGRLGFYQHVRPLVIGLVHGLAGSAAVALLVLTTIRNPRWAVAYLLIFGVGTVAGMMLITMSIASALHIVDRGNKTFARRLGLASGVLSLLFGLVVAYQIGFGGGLFSSHPQWTPR
jgi:high-affinity nickel permease